MRASARSRKKLRAEQFDRACSLREYLNRYVANFGNEGARLSTNATAAIVNWLACEYRLGMNAQRRKSAGSK